MPPSTDYILISTSSAPAVETAGPNRGLREITQEIVRVAQVPSQALAANFQAFAETISRALAAIPEATSSFQIDEVEVSAEVSGEGKLQLIGGLTAGIKGGITFKLKRRPPAIQQ